MAKGQMRSNKEIKKPKKEKPKPGGTSTSPTARMGGAQEKSKPPKR